VYVCVVSCYVAYTIICLGDPLFVNKLNGRVFKNVMREIRENILLVKMAVIRNLLSSRFCYS